MDHIASFRQSLAETMVWCSARATLADPQHCLRTPALQPSPLEYTQSLTERQACVGTVIDTRSQLLRDAGLEPQTLPSDLAGGRLLLYAPDETLSDGAATVGSEGFFDVNNVPPWDCWVLYVPDPLTPEHCLAEQARGRRPGRWSSIWPTPQHDVRRDALPLYEVDPRPRHSYLVSWVAPVLIPLVFTGILYNPENCIEWLADRDTPFTQALDALHLLV